MGVLYSKLSRMPSTMGLNTLFKLTLLWIFPAFCMIHFANFAEGHTIEDIERKIRLKRIPAYCPYMQTGSRAGRSQGLNYKAQLGRGWIHTHHYCWGLDNIIIAFQDPNNEQHFGGKLHTALRAFDYVLKNTANYDFILKPEILFNKGRVLSWLGKERKAVAVFWSAIRLKPDYVLPYIPLMELLLKNGEIDQAQTLINTGLKHSPNSPLLKQAHDKFNMKKK